VRNLLHHWPLIVPFLVGQFGFDFGDITSVLLSYLSDLVSFLLAAVSYIWSVLVYVANYIWGALNWVWNFVYNLFKNIAAAFKWIWDNIIKGALTKLVKLFLRVRTWLKQTFGPVISFLKKLRAYYQWYFNHYVKPLLQLLGIVRKVLGIFRLLGFKWAARLDADIAGIEQKIVQVYSKLIGYINLAITWLDLIVDPLGILRRNPLFAALINDAPALRNLVLGAGIRPLTGAESSGQARDRALATPANAKQNFQTYYSQRKVTPEQDCTITEFKKAYADLQAGTSDYGN